MLLKPLRKSWRMTITTTPRSVQISLVVLLTYNWLVEHLPCPLPDFYSMLLYWRWGRCGILQKQRGKFCARPRSAGSEEECRDRGGSGLWSLNFDLAEHPRCKHAATYLAVGSADQGRWESLNKRVLSTQCNRSDQYNFQVTYKSFH